MKTGISFLFFLATTYIMLPQDIDRPPDLGQSVISTQGNHEIGVYSADSFSFHGLIYIPLEVTFYGKRTTPSPIANLVTSFNIFFYNDDNGMPNGNPDIPNSGFWELKNINLQYVTIYEDTDAVNFTIDFEAVNGGERIAFPQEMIWMTAFPTVESDVNGPGRWNWSGSSHIAEYIPVLIDPHDVFGTGATDWTPLTDLGIYDFNTFAWKMTGEHGDPVSVEDHPKKSFLIFPNPTKNVLSIESPLSSIDKIEVFDICGKQIQFDHHSNQIDLSRFSAGIYFISIESESQKFIHKIVKN